MRDPDPAPARRRPPWWVVGVLAVVFTGAALAAAYLDWIWWEPYKGLTVTLAAIGILVVAGVLAIVRATRPVAVLAAAVGLGIVAGQAIGPARPVLIRAEGTLTVTLTSPRTTTGTAAVTCATNAAGTELQVSGDPNLRLDIFPDNPAAPPDVDQREFVSVSLTVGDRWTPGPEPRADAAHLGVTVGRVEADAAESRMAAGRATPLQLHWTNDGGTLGFSGLVPDTRGQEATGEFVDLAGTMSWTCEQGVAGR